MTIKCPHCGEICESDSDIPVGQPIECPFCAKRFSYTGEMALPNGDRSSGTATESNNESRFCGHCGTKIPATASFCPHCGSKNALAGKDKTAEAKADSVSSVVEPVAETSSPNPGKFQKLLNLIKVSLILSALSGIVSCIDIKEAYTLGRAGTFVISAAFLGLGIWLYLEVMHLKSWARKTFIVYTFLVAALFLFGVQAGGNGNLVVTGLDVAGLLINLYCVYLLFTKDVAAVFKPDSELTDARAVTNMINCIGYWLAFGLIILVGLVWAFLHDGTDDWEKDCLEAAVAGSSSAREELIVHVANQSEDQDIEDVIEYVDACIRAKSPNSSPARSSDSTQNHVPITIWRVLGKIIVGLGALIGGWFSKIKKE